MRPDEEIEHVRNTRMHWRKDTVTTAKSTAVFRRGAAKKEICNFSSHISFRTQESFALDSVSIKQGTYTCPPSHDLEDT